MAYVVASHHPAPEAAANAQSIQQAMAAISQGTPLTPVQGNIYTGMSFA